MVISSDRPSFEETNAQYSTREVRVFQLSILNMKTGAIIAQFLTFFPGSSYSHLWATLMPPKWWGKLLESGKRRSTQNKMTFDRLNFLSLFPISLLFHLCHLHPLLHDLAQHLFLLCHHLTMLLLRYLRNISPFLSLLFSLPPLQISSLLLHLLSYTLH